MYLLLKNLVKALSTQLHVAETLVKHINNVCKHESDTWTLCYLFKGFRALQSSLMRVATTAQLHHHAQRDPGANCQVYLLVMYELVPVSVSLPHHYRTFGSFVMLKQTFVELLTFKVSLRTVRAHYYTIFTLVIPYT